RRHAPRDLQRQALTRELICNEQPPQHPAALVAIVNEVPAPHVVDPGSAMTHDAAPGSSQPPLFPLFNRHFEPFLPPQPMHTLAVDPPAVPPQQRVNPTVAVAWPTSHQLVQPLHDRRL